MSEAGDPIREVSKMFARQISNVKQQASMRTMKKAKAASFRRARKSSGKSVTIVRRSRRVR